MATQASQAADKLVRDVRQAYLDGAAKLDFDKDDAEEMLKMGTAAELSWSWMPTSEQQRRVEALMKQLGGDVERWATVQRGWAERGLRDDGSLFNWERWEARGRDLAKDLEKHTGQLVGEAVFNLFNAVVVKPTLATAADVVLPWRWPLSLQVAVVVGAVIVGAAVLRPYVVPFLPRST